MDNARLDEAEVFFRAKLEGIDEPTAPFGVINVYSSGKRVREVEKLLDLALCNRARAQGRSLNISVARLLQPRGHLSWLIRAAAILLCLAQCYWRAGSEGAPAPPFWGCP
jgi:hypothetical protein